MYNNFDATARDPDYPNVHGEPASCTNAEPWWCAEWPLSHGSSSTTYVYLADSLNDNQSGETLNFKAQTRNAFDRWNVVPALEPFLVEAASISESSGWLDYNCATRVQRGTLSLGVYAKTSVRTEYLLLGSGSHTLIGCFWVTLSNYYRFDTNNDPDDGFIDARFVFGHELGHGLSLGHTAHRAIMYPRWPTDVYMGIVPTSDDIDGLQHAYGTP